MDFTWDIEATIQITDFATDPTARQLVGELKEIVQDVWATNLQRYEPEALGDTPRALGHLSAENITQRVLRSLGRGSDLYEKGVRVSTPETSLLIEYRGYRIRVVKAPSASRRNPDWFRDFSWSSGSAVRHDAAWRNSRSVDIVLGNFRQPALFELEVEEHLGDAYDCRDIFLVWAGELGPEARTSGWLGLPSLGPSPWLSVVDAWQDGREAADEKPTDETSTTGPAAPSYESAATPAPRVTLKRNRVEELGA